MTGWTSWTELDEINSVQLHDEPGGVRRRVGRNASPLIGDAIGPTVQLPTPNPAASVAAPFVLGIDPGKRGAPALLDSVAGTLEVEDVPTLAIRGKTVVDHYGLARIVDACLPRNPLVVIEQVGSRPGEGHAAAFDFGRTCGLILGICAAHFLRVEYVGPSIWKRAMRLQGDKDESRQRACTLFPRQSALFARVKDDGRAEAALIATYGAQALGVPS